MQTIRAFAAIEVSASIRSALAKIIQKLDGTGNMIKWVTPEQLHLTLHFLGDLRYQDIQPVSAAIKEALAECDPFELQLRGVGVFPDLEQPRVIWTGIEMGYEPLVELQRALDGPLASLGYPSDKHHFRPHVTLGRIKRLSRLYELQQALSGVTQVNGGAMIVDEVTLFESNLHRRGPDYTPIAEFELGWRV